MTNQKKLVVLIIMVALISGVIYASRVYLNKNLVENKKQEQNTVPKLNEITSTDLPPGITNEWILEKDAKVLSKSFNTVGSQIQGSLLYESKLSMQDAVTAYEKFLKGKGYTTTVINNKQVGTYSINAINEKAKSQAYIVVDENDISKVVTVDVTVILPVLTPIQQKTQD